LLDGITCIEEVFMAKVTGGKTLHFTRVAWEKMWGLTLRAPGEIQGFGIVDEHDPSRVVDFHIVSQVCSATGSIIDQDELHELFLNKRDEGISMDRWRVWWHSHAAMKTFFSDTDENNIERYASEGALWSVVTNHADAKRVAAGKSPTEMYVRVDCFDPDRPKDLSSPRRFTIEDCGWQVGPVQVVPDLWFTEQIAKTRVATRQVVDMTKNFRGHVLQGVSTGHNPNALLRQAPDNRRYHPNGTLLALNGQGSRVPSFESQAGYEDFYEQRIGYSPNNWGTHGWEDDMYDKGPATPVTSQAPVSADRRDGAVLHPYFSHPFIEGMYLYGMLDRDEADRLDEDFLTEEITDRKLISHLTRMWYCLVETEMYDLDENDLVAAMNGYGPDEQEEEEEEEEEEETPPDSMQVAHLLERAVKGGI
jgi:hypothetical protein